MVSHQRLWFLVIIFDVFITEWFAVWSSTADQRLCLSKVGNLAYARIISDQRIIQGIIPDMIIECAYAWWFRMESPTRL